MSLTESFLRRITLHVAGESRSLPPGFLPAIGAHPSSA
ncbi:hypothetical protein NOC27_505 [Nitrosococcus oceani AFC27]|nr:hypothetical protein NOC27_505 [Nitrosococcus oceani AFC27]